MDLTNPVNMQLNNPVAFEEVLGFSAHLLAQLPLPTTLVIEVEWWNTPVIFVVNDRARDPIDGCPVFDGKEFAAIVKGVENDRVWSTDLRQWCNVKKRDPGWRVKESEVMGGVVNPDFLGWTLDRVLKRIEAKLLSLEVAQDS